MERIEHEKAVVGKMIGIYCRKKHACASGRLCEECRELLEYAENRLSRCPKGNSKGSCRRCEIHCYSPVRREQIRTVMRYVGPRMMYLKPIEALRHILSEIH